MDLRQLGATDLHITPVGCGSWAIGGGDWQFGWGGQRDVDSIAAIHRALELGVNWIDTAAAYGFGHSETVVARAVAGLQEKPYIFTKGSLVEGSDRKVAHSLKRKSLRDEVDASLRRLGVGSIDLYQIHWPIPDEDIEEGWSALNELKQEGKLRHIGVSNFSVAQLNRAQAIAPVETLQPPYSLVARVAEQEILPHAEREGIGVISYSPMGSGRLSGKMTRETIDSLPANDWRRRDARGRFQEPQLSHALAVAERVKLVGVQHGVAPGAAAVAWTLLHPAVDGVIIGFRHPDQVDDLLPAAVELELTPDEVSMIETDTNSPEVFG